jgi:hypothetical protein
MITRHSEKQKYRPGFEGLERRLFLSAGLQASVAHTLVPVQALVVPNPESGGPLPCGTGKGIIIITSR